MTTGLKRQPFLLRFTLDSGIHQKRRKSGNLGGKNSLLRRSLAPLLQPTIKKGKKKIQLPYSSGAQSPSITLDEGTAGRSGITLLDAARSPGRPQERRVGYQVRNSEAGLLNARGGALGLNLLYARRRMQSDQGGSGGTISQVTDHLERFHAPRDSSTSGRA